MESGSGRSEAWWTSKRGDCAESEKRGDGDSSHDRAGDGSSAETQDAHYSKTKVQVVGEKGLKLRLERPKGSNQLPSRELGDWKG